MANFLKKIGGMFSSGNDSVLGIDIGSSSIKIVQLRRKGGSAILETYGELALGPYSGLEVGKATMLPEAKLIEALKDVIRESHVTTNKCGIAIPLRSSLLSVMTMPGVSEDQLNAMIPLEARKYIPVPISEVMLDWSIIPQNISVSDTQAQSEKSGIMGVENSSTTSSFPTVEVLLVAIHNNAIGQYQSVSQGVGLEVSFFEIEIFSTIRASLDRETEPLMVFDMGAAATKLYILDQGIVRNSHTVNRGSQEVTAVISRSLNIPSQDAEILKRRSGLESIKDERLAGRILAGSVDFLFSEANRVITNYQMKYNKIISKVVLSGGGVNLKGFEKLAKEKLKINIQRADPFSKVSSPAFFDEVLKEAGPEFAVAIGVALRKLLEDK